MSDMPTSLDSVVKVPPGTKLWLLHLGDLEADLGWMVRGGNSTGLSSAGLPMMHERRTLAMLSVLIDHPKMGLILYEVGAGKDYPTVWGAPLNDIFARVNYKEEHELGAAIAATGNDIKDVKAIICGHLHLDHAGALEHFRGTNIPVYVHELELKQAFYSVATKSDLGVYLPYYLSFDINWKTFTGSFLEIAQGLTLRHSPGHTPGLCILVVNMQQSGTWIFTSDQYHVRENYEDSHPQGWLARDHDQWVRSHQMIQMLARRTEAKIILGHDKERLMEYKLPDGKFYL